MVILLILLVICISSLFAFGIISYGKQIILFIVKLFLQLLHLGTQCSEVRMTLHDNMLVTMLVISCLGITILITIWSFIVYGVYKNRSKFHFYYSLENVYYPEHAHLVLFDSFRIHIAIRKQRYQVSFEICILLASFTHASNEKMLSEIETSILHACIL